MSTSQFIFVRHGESEANAIGIIADANSPLTSVGIEQARKTGLELGKLGGIDTVVCSPYLRAQQTAEIIAGELGIDLEYIQIVEELRERDWGKYQGTPKNKIIDKNWFIVSDDPDIEPSQTLLIRMKVAYRKIAKLCETQTVLAVGHAVSGLYLIEVAKGVKEAADLGSDRYIANADFIKVDIT